MIKYLLVFSGSYVRRLVVKAKAVAFATWHSCTPCRHSYAQSGEDAIVLAELTRLGEMQGIYIDVGANHPTRLSNTYLFYRSGLRGIVIEPADPLLQLHRSFRAGDVQIKTACGDRPTVAPFLHAASHVLSGFATPRLKASPLLSEEYMPVLRLDDIVPEITNDPILLLSIDVEGYDMQVVQGASKTLARSRFVIVEGSPNDQEMVKYLETRGFSVFATTPHNVVFKKAVGGDTRALLKETKPDVGICENP